MVSLYAGFCIEIVSLISLKGSLNIPGHIWESAVLKSGYIFHHL